MHSRLSTGCVSQLWFKSGIFVAVLLLFARGAAATDLYKIDSTNSFITFSAKNLGLSSIKGRFGEFEGLIGLSDSVITGARATIYANSVDTGVQRWNELMRSAEFFDATNHPTITFQSKRVVKKRVYGNRHNLWEGSVSVFGDLTMHGITRELRFTAKQNGPVKDLAGNVRIGIEGKTKIKRKDFGIAFDQVSGNGVPIVAQEVEIELNIQAVKREISNK